MTEENKSPLQIIIRELRHNEYSKLLKYLEKAQGKYWYQFCDMDSPDCEESSNYFTFSVDKVAHTPPVYYGIKISPVNKKWVDEGKGLRSSLTGLAKLVSTFI